MGNLVSAPSSRRSRDALGAKEKNCCYSSASSSENLTYFERSEKAAIPSAKEKQKKDELASSSCIPRHNIAIKESTPAISSERSYYKLKTLNYNMKDINSRLNNLTKNQANIIEATIPLAQKE